MDMVSTFISDNMYDRMRSHRNRIDVLPPIITPPPSQDSSQHILNALNDKCIQRILSYLIGDIRDFLSAAEVCKKFQDNAKKCFPSIYADFYMGQEMDYHLPMYRVQTFLSIFGHLIESLKWIRNRQNTFESEIFNAIADFCGNSLRRLFIHRHDLDFIIASQFKSLDELTLIGCKINNFKVPSMLRKLVACRGVEFNSMD